MLKTHANPADKDSLFSYVNSDPLMRRMLADQPDDNDADEQHQQREIAQITASDEFKKMKRTLRTQNADRTTKPLSDERIVNMILQRREVVRNRKLRESQQQVEGE